MNYPAGLILIVVIMFMAITNTDSRSLPNNLRRCSPKTKDDRQNCKCILQGHSQKNRTTDIVCCHIQNEQDIQLNCSDLTDAESISGVVKSLVIESSNLKTFSLTYSLTRRMNISIHSLESLVIVNTNISTIDICDSQVAKLQKEDSDVISCEELSSLKSLDLRGNRLTSLAEFRIPALKELYLSGNRWVCFKEALRGKRNTLAAFFSDSEKWQPHESAMTGWLVQRYEKILKDADTTFCDKVNTLENVRHNNKTESNVPLLELLKFNKTMYENCPEKCRCRIDNMNVPLWVEVSCSEANMSALPEILPPNTLKLNVSHNQIQTLAPVRTNRHYQHLRELTANDNALTSMSDLTGSHFLKNNPLVLNLQYNKITVFDLGVLRPIISNHETNPGGNDPASLTFLFAENPWSCDCEFVKEIQEFLYHRIPFLRDAELLYCGGEPDEDNTIIRLKYDNFCHTDVYIDATMIIVIFEVVLLILIICKLIYDVRHYNRTGELPWLARHISPYGCCCFSFSSLKSANQNHSDWHPPPSNGVGSGRRHRFTPPSEASGRIQTRHYNGSEGTSSTASTASLFFSWMLCFGKESRSSASSNKTSGSYEWNMSFRPRRRTASTSGCSSRACGIHGGGEPASTNSLKSPLNINHSNHQNQALSSLGNRMEAADLIERCSSGSHRSMASSPTSTSVRSSHQQHSGRFCHSEQPQTAVVAASSSEPVAEQPRVKKISLEEAQQFRKEVLDPQFPEMVDHETTETTVFISNHVTATRNGSETKSGTGSDSKSNGSGDSKTRQNDEVFLDVSDLINDEPSLLLTNGLEKNGSRRNSIRKISRLNSASFHSNYSYRGGTAC